MCRKEHLEFLPLENNGALTRYLAPIITIGIDIFPGDGESATTLLRRADEAMHHPKEGGRNQYLRYHKPT